MWSVRVGIHYRAVAVEDEGSSGLVLDWHPRRIRPTTQADVIAVTPSQGCEVPRHAWPYYTCGACGALRVDFFLPVHGVIDWPGVYHFLPPSRKDAKRLAPKERALIGQGAALARGG
jgi:hypothetical protein